MAFFDKFKKFGQGVALGSLDTTARMLPTLMQHRFQRQERIDTENRAEDRQLRAEGRQKVTAEEEAIQRMFDSGRFEEAINRANTANLKELAAKLEAAKPGAIAGRAAQDLPDLETAITGDIEASRGTDFLTKTPEQRDEAVRAMEITEADLRRKAREFADVSADAGRQTPPPGFEALEEADRLNARSMALRNISTVQQSIPIYTMNRDELNASYESYRRAFAAATDEATADGATRELIRSVNILRSAEFMKGLSAYRDPDQLLTDAVRYGLSGVDLMRVQAVAFDLRRTLAGEVLPRETEDKNIAFTLLKLAREQAIQGRIRGDEGMVSDARDQLLNAADLFEKYSGTKGLAADIKRSQASYLLENLDPGSMRKDIFDLSVMAADAPLAAAKVLRTYGEHVDDPTNIPLETITRVIKEKVYGLAPGAREEATARNVGDAVDAAIDRIGIDRSNGIPIEISSMDILSSMSEELTEEERAAFVEEAFSKGWVVSFEFGEMRKLPWNAKEIGPIIDQVLETTAKILDAPNELRRKATPFLTDPEIGGPALAAANKRTNFLRSPEARMEVINLIKEAASDFLSGNPPLTPQQQEVINRQRGGLLFMRAQK
jgi:hypothetical protein